MPPLPMSSRISSCGNSGASSAMVGGLNGGCFASVTVSSAAPNFSRHAGQRPASAPVGRGVPHCGHLGAGFNRVSLIYPPQKQITTDVTEKYFNFFGFGVVVSEIVT